MKVQYFPRRCINPTRILNDFKPAQIEYRELQVGTSRE